MKLKELLVQELPKGGGWPDGAVRAGFTCTGDTLYFYDEDHNCPEAWRFGMSISPDNLAEEVSLEEYEAALAAAQPQWDGEGLPPVGVECEALIPCSSGEAWEWRKVKVVVSGIKGAENECLVYDVENTRPAWVDEFRPIRSESDKKRDAAVVELSSVIDYRNGCSSKPLAGWLYDAIAAGKIPHVHIE